MKIDVMGDIQNGKVVVNLWFSSNGFVGAELNLSERQATLLMGRITKALHECHVTLLAQPTTGADQAEEG